MSRVRVIDSHTGGEPTRVVISGAPDLGRATVAERLSRYRATPIVLDPVMVATSGDRLLKPDAIEAMRTKLMPLAAVVTPNLPEAAALLDAPEATSEDEMVRQAERLLAFGARAVLSAPVVVRQREFDSLVNAAGTRCQCRFQMLRTICR